MPIEGPLFRGIQNLLAGERAEEACGAQSSSQTGSTRALRGADGVVRAPDLGAPDAIDKVSAWAVSGFFGNTGVFKADVEDFRGVDDVHKVMNEPLVTEPNERPFGKTVVFRPGLANTPPSPAYLFRLARYTDKVVVAHGNASPGQDLTPQPVDEIYGMKVPDELKGKIYASGIEDHRMITWGTASDLFERQLEAMGDSDVLGGGSVESANVTVFGYSMGGVDAAATRKRLEEQGRGGVIGKLINVSAPMRGTPISDEAFFGLAARGLQITGGRAPDAVRALDPDHMARTFSDRDQRLVDLAVSNSLETDGWMNARPLMRGMAKAFKWNPFNRFRSGPSDGWVNTSSMEFGKEVMRLDQPYDHPGVAENPKIVDDIARRLANGG